MDRSRNQKVINRRWLYTKKLGIPGVKSKRYKARFVDRGFTQRKYIYYEEVFALVVKHILIRIMMSLVVDE